MILIETILRSRIDFAIILFELLHYSKHTRNTFGTFKDISREIILRARIKFVIFLISFCIDFFVSSFEQNYF